MTGWLANSFSVAVLNSVSDFAAFGLDILGGIPRNGERISGFIG